MSNQYSPSAGGSAGGDGQKELDELLRQAEAQAHQIRVMNAVDKMYEDQGYTASLEMIEGQAELLMRMSLPELQDFVNNLFPQATTEADGNTEG
ncbi:hypothetical protein KC331_g4726 [Hortaea werneckii]|nr:hypothetical protein KC354_g16336 [Hortaea werneckii]KAI7547914.1 hypothetical protein KC331_g4726 [Hortaea werneckii]KAI7722599.1 hypothetical protein KC353_g369 [Hortaea werneckii]